MRMNASVSGGGRWDRKLRYFTHGGLKRIKEVGSQMSSENREGEVREGPSRPGEGPVVLAVGLASLAIASHFTQVPSLYNKYHRRWGGGL